MTKTTEEVWKQILHKEDQGIMTPCLSPSGELGIACVKCEAVYNLSQGGYKNKMELTDELTLYSK